MKQIHTILIANRGEIASRVIRSCNKMGITAVAVYSDADKQAPFVREADIAVHIGEPEPAKSYLDQDKIIAAAKRTNANAIHPGYGFLSENAGFAERCEKEGIIFIGPNPNAISSMGSKSLAKALMEKSGVPVVPGYKGEDQSDERLITEAKKVGFPLLLKATAGGGGKGMRIVREEKELESAISAAKREAKNAFGDDEMLIEKYIESGRHIEFQIFGDKHGNALHLLERECTIQRRYQKVIEESPSPVMSEELRATMGDAAVKAAKALAYDNAGTVEFIYDDKTGDFYFLEVNTRLQVEHPVTECVTGLDLVQMQIEVAGGRPLQITQDDVKGTGYAIEARLYAEDASQNFMPATGKVHQISYPAVEGLRVDSAIEAGSEISIFYDPMIAKIIVWDTDRQSAQAKMNYVVQNTICQGVVTNLSFLKHLLGMQDFKDGNYDTHFIDNHIKLEGLDILSEPQLQEACIAATLYDWKVREDQRSLMRSIPSGWRNNFYAPQKETFVFGEEKTAVNYRFKDGKFSIQVGESEHTVAITGFEKGALTLEIDGLQQTYAIHAEGQERFVHHASLGNVKLLLQDRFPEKEKEKVKGGYEAPMPSQIIKVVASSGTEVKEGDPLLIITSMKMENTILAEETGTVEEVFVTEGQNVEAGYLLLKIKTDEG